MSTATAAWALDGPRLEGLELIVSGLLPGVDGFGAPRSDASGTQPIPNLVLPAAVAEHVQLGEALELCDTENTPLALLRIDDLLPLDDGSVSAVGPVRRLRRAEHGPARELRLRADLDLSGSVVAVCSSGVRPADLLRAARAAGGGPLTLVAEGSADRSESARLVAELQAAAELLPDTQVRFVPRADIGDATVDLTLLALAAVGASAPLDLRRPESARGAGAVVLFTGLSGAGKSTVARALAEWITARTEHRAVLLDGDDLRRELAAELGFSAEDRQKNLERQAWVAARVAEAGGLAICAPIAPFAASRAAMRAKVEPASRFILIHVATPLAVAEGRDRKGLYAKARAGLIADFTGIDSPYEIPEDADLSIDTSTMAVEECVAAVVALLAEEGILGERVRGS